MNEKHRLTQRELGTVLAALRLWQKGCTDPELIEVARNGRSFKQLDFYEIDELCDRLNTGWDPSYEDVASNTDRNAPGLG